MKADSFAKLVVLDALIEAEVGYFLEHGSSSLELFREGMVARMSDLIDDIDVLDSVAAARAYDASVDFLADLPEDEDGVVEAAIRFRRAIDKLIARGMDRRDLAAASTWAVVLDELLSELADEYHTAVGPDGGIRPREFNRVRALLNRSRLAADRMLWGAEVIRPEMFDELDRLAYAVRNRRLRPTAIDQLIRPIQRRAAKFRPTSITSVGAFVFRQLIKKDPKQRLGRAGRERGGNPAGPDRRRSGA